MSEDRGFFVRSVQFAAIPAWLLRHPDVTYRQVFLWGHLYIAGWEDRETWVTYEDLAATIRCSESSVKRDVKHLEAIGALRRTSHVTSHGQQSNSYFPRMDPPDPSVTSDRRGSPSVTSDTPQAGSPVTQPTSPSKEVKCTAKSRKRDEVFERMCELEGLNYADLNPTQRGKINRHLGAIRSVRPSLSTADLDAAAAAYRREWPTMPLTAQALAGHWSKFAPAVVDPADLADRQFRDAVYACWDSQGCWVDEFDEEHLTHPQESGIVRLTKDGRACDSDGRIYSIAGSNRVYE